MEEVQKELIMKCKRVANNNLKIRRRHMKVMESCGILVNKEL